MNSENNNKNDVLPNGVRIAIAIGTLISILVAFNQCTPSKKTTNSSKKTRSVASASNKDVPVTSTGDAADIESDAKLPDGLVMPPINAVTEESDMDQLDVGIKSFEQIYYSMATVTGVSPNDVAVMRLYKEIIVQLPPDNNIKSFLSSNQVAITKLSSEFCEKLVETQNLRAVIWPTLNLNQPPSQVINATNKQIIINQAIDAFMPPLDSQTKVMTTNELGKLFDELLVGENLTMSSTTRKVVKGMCISTLASAHSTLL